MRLEQHLKQLGEMTTPDQSWISKNRADFLSQNLPQESPFEKGGNRGILQLFSFFPRLATGAIIVLVAVFGGTGLASAAKRAMPGRSLYPIKLALEQTGVKFIPDHALKTKVQIALAGERLSEARQVASEEGAAEKAGQALDQFKNHLSDVASNLDPDQVAGTTPQKAAEFSHLFVKHSKEYQKQLDATVAALPAPAKGKAEEIKRQVSDSSLKAMEVLTATAKLGAVPEEKVAEDLKETVEDAETRVKTVEGKAFDLKVKRAKSKLQKDQVGLPQVPADENPDNPLISTEMAKKMLGEAKDLISAKDLTGALDKVKDSAQIINRVEESESLKENN